MSSVFRNFLFGALLAAAALAGSRVDADEAQDAIRRAVERGEVRPLEEIIAGLHGKMPGEIAGIEVEHKDGRWVYEFRVVDGAGRLFEAHVDAKTGEMIRVEEK